jgi:hypothetical protein
MSTLLHSQTLSLGMAATPRAPLLRPAEVLATNRFIDRTESIRQLTRVWPTWVGSGTYASVERGPSPGHGKVDSWA